MTMGENVSESKIIINNSPEEQDNAGVSVRHELYRQYRLWRKIISAFIREKLKKQFSDILYITAGTVPEDFITKLQRQYPDKMIQVLIPVFEDDKNFEKTNICFDYFLQNKNYTATVYKIPTANYGIKIYGVYTKKFKEIKNYKDIYNIKYLSHFSKIARKVAVKLKPDLVFADNIPLLLGLEFGNRWTSGYPLKFIQNIHNSSFYKDTESFWTAINLVNKKEMKKLCKDNAINKNLALLFNLKYTKNFKKFRGCLSYLYKHYDEYREKVNLGEQTKENIILERLNERIEKLFPEIKNFNPVKYSSKKACARTINSLSDINQYKADKYISLLKKSENNTNDKIKHPFNSTNFRGIRDLNKKYLVREFSEKRIEIKFIDLSVFTSSEISIHGYFDSYLKAPLIFIPFNEYIKEDDIKTASFAILKLFELRKNIQVIYNVPENMNSPYLKALFDFFAGQPALKGKWLTIEGKINIPQFMAASDIILIPSGECLNIENAIFSALQYGCIPVVGNDGICADIVTDIFDDMNKGCGFKAEKVIGDTENYIETYRENYTNTVIKALDFMSFNKSSWNVIIANALNYNSGWDFRTLEKYNNIFDDIL